MALMSSTFFYSGDFFYSLFPLLQLCKVQPGEEVSLSHLIFSQHSFLFQARSAGCQPCKIANEVVVKILYNRLPVYHLYFSLFPQGNSSYWCSDLLKASEEFLSSVTLKQDSIDEELLTRHLFTVGEVAQVCCTCTISSVNSLIK